MTLKSNEYTISNVYSHVRNRAIWVIWVISLLFAGALGAAYDDYASVKQKFDQIEGDHLRAGTRVELTVRELAAYAEREGPTRRQEQGGRPPA